MKLPPPKALSFDCYGTLIDWESGIITALRPWLARDDDPLPNETVLEAFGSLETEVERQHPDWPYPEVLAETLRRIGRNTGREVLESDTASFAASVGDWPAFADSTEALRRLQRRCKLVILSNVDRRSFAATERRLGVRFDLVVTAEDVGAYKPELAGFRTMFERLRAIGVERGQLLHVAQSLFHDHEPAHRLGLPSVWIDRRHDRHGAGATPVSDVEPRWRFPSMADFADALLAS